MATIFLFFVSLFIDSEDDRITISNALDYAIFKESEYNRVFVAVTNEDVVQQTDNSPTPPVATPRAEALPVERKRVVLPMEYDVPIFGASPVQREIPMPIYSTPTSASVPSTPLTSKPNKALHLGVVCDGCDGDIVGFRYKCMDCFDFDLCMDCESKMMHSQHIMLRISNPDEIDMRRLKLRKRIGRHRHEERPTEPKRPHNGHGHGRHGHGKRHSESQGPISDLLNAVINYQSTGQTPPSAPSPSMQQSNQSTQVDGSLNQEKTQPQTNATNVKAGSIPTNGAPQTSPIAACIQNIPELIRMGISKAQSAQSSKCPMQGNYKSGLDALADLANNFAVMMDPFAASFDFESTSAPATAPTTAPSPANSAATTATASEPATPVAADVREPQPESKVAEANVAAAPTHVVVPAVAATTSEPQRVAAESVLIEDVDDDEDELMRDLLKKMTTFNGKKGSPAVSEKTSAATSMEIDGENSPVKEWTLLNADDTESDVASTSEKPSTGTIPKRPSLVTDAASQAEAALKQSEIASTAAYAAVQAATEAQEKAEQIEYAELSRLLGEHIKSTATAARMTEPAPATRTSPVVSIVEEAASAPLPSTSAAGK